METNHNYKLVTQDLISHFFRPKAPQRQKRYLRHGLYDPREEKIYEFIFRINKIVKSIHHLSLFGINQGLPEYDILKLVEFALSQVWQKQLPVQVFDSLTQSLN